MQNSTSLNDLYAEFSAGLLEKREFEGAIFKSIEEDIYRLSGFDREDQEDYFTWLYPRISRAITTYRETGASFEIYIDTLVRLTAKEYRLRQMRDHAAESTAWITQIPEMYAYENEPEYDECVTVAQEKSTKLKNSRQLLILVLKCSSYVSYDFLERISSRLGMDPAKLCNMIKCLKEQRTKRESDIKMLHERACCQFFRCIFYERTLQTMQQDSIAAQRLRRQLERGRNRLARMRKRLEQLRPDPTNQQIAKLLGIAKGTVDSTLYALKVRWNIKHNGNILN